MDSITEFLHMGGYAKFVWPAYIIALIGLGGVLWQSLASWKARETEFNTLKQKRGTSSDGSAS